MSRTTTALKRLGVPSLAAVTLVAGLPLFVGTAQAAHITSLDLTPATASGAAGSCEIFTVQLNFASPAQAQAETVDVVLTEGAVTGTGTAANQDVDFCVAPQGGVTPATGSDASDTGAAGTSDRAEFRTDATGKVSFGVTANLPGAVNIRAFYETTDNDTFDAGEFTDTSTYTVTTGGPAGSNDNADAATDVEVLSAGQTPATADNNDTTDAVEGEARTFRVYVSNANGDPLAGVSVQRTIDSDVNAADSGPAIFATTNNDGIATGTVTFPARTGGASDTVNFFVNQTDGVTNNDDDPAADVIEPNDTVVVAIQQDTNQTNRTVTVVCEATVGDNALNTENPCVNSALDGDRVFRAVVDAGTDTATTEGTLLAFTVTGGSGDETVTPSEASTTGAQAGPAATADTNDSGVTFTVNDPTPTVGQVLTVTATVRGTTVSDTETLTFRNAPTDARTISLTPETETTAPNTARQFTATVLDVDGKPVQGVTVTFTEDGAGAFRNGSSSVDAVTNANGVATVEAISLPGETGTQNIRATISTAGTQCTNAANTGQDPQGNALNTTTNTGGAGNCFDTAVNTFSTTPAASPSATPTATTSPTATPTATTSPSGPPSVPCTVPASITLDRDTITATGSAQITVRATPNSIVQVFAYSRPSTTYRVVRQIEVGGDGVASDRIVPPTNTRLYAQQNGCNASPSIVLNVRTQISLNVVRNGVRNYTFSGSLLPARPNGLIASLYRVTNDGRQILTAQTRANANVGQPGYDARRPAGSYTIVRQFTGSGRFGFVVRTGQDLQNAPGSSNVRSLAVF